MELREVAEAARVSESTVRRWLRNEELPAYRLGRQLRVRVEEFEDFLNRQWVRFSHFKDVHFSGAFQSSSDIDS